MLQKDHSYLCGKHSHYSKAILGDLKKHFYHELLENFSDNRLILLERRATLPDSVNIKPQSAQNLIYTLQKIKKSCC